MVLVSGEGAGLQSRCAIRRTRVFVTLLFLLYANVSSPRPPPLHSAEETAFLCPFRWLPALHMRQRGLGHLTRILSSRASQTPVSTLLCSVSHTARISSTSSSNSSSISTTNRGTSPPSLPSGTSMLDHCIREEGKRSSVLYLSLMLTICFRECKLLEK